MPKERNKSSYLDKEPFKGSGQLGWISSMLIVSLVFLWLGVEFHTIMIMYFVMPIWAEIFDNIGRLWNDRKK